MEERAALPSEVLGRQVKKWRTRRKLTAQGLANRASEIGASTLTRAAISKIEVGQRGVSLDEWLQLAHVLAVPPPLLFLNLESGSDVAIAPAAILHPWLAWQWVVGEEPPVLTNRSVSRAPEFGDAKRAIWLYQRESAAAGAVHRAVSAIASAEYADDRDRLREARTQHADALRELAGVLDEMVEADMTPPGLPRSWVDTMRSLKLLKYPDRVSIFEVADDAG